MRTSTSSKRFFLRGASSVALSAMLIAGPDMVWAATCEWNASGDWSNGSLWSCGAVPGQSDTVIIDGGKTVTISNEGESTGAMTVGAAATVALNNSTLNQYGDVINNGTITLANASRLQNQAGALTYSGAGTIALDDTANYAQIYGGTVTFGSGQTVDGSGQIGLNGTFVVNNGVISATAAGRTLDIDASGGNGGSSGSGIGSGGNASLYNTNLMQANASTLQLEGGWYENSASGVIKAIDGGAVVLNGDARIVGGSLTTDAASAINITSSTNYLQSVTLTSGSNLNVVNGTLEVNTSLVNNGTITVSNASVLYGEAPTTSYSGTGAIILDDSLNYARILSGQITFGSGQTVRGAGQLGVNSGTFINNGLISADAGTGIDIDASGGNGGLGVNNGVGTNGNASLYNANLMQATGSTLSFEGGLYENAANAVIQAVNNSTIVLNGDSRILNGTLTSDATSTISAANTTQYLQTVTLSTGSRLNVFNDNLWLNTTLTNNGTIDIVNASNLLAETSALTINGAGTIVLDDSANYARIYNGQITFGSGQTVEGSGQLGVNSGTFINNGLISADAGTVSTSTRPAAMAASA